jgi:hypothetical protein
VGVTHSPRLQQAGKPVRRYLRISALSDQVKNQSVQLTARLKQSELLVACVFVSGARKGARGTHH